VRQEKISDSKGGGLVLHVTARPERLYDIAENMDLKIMDAQGVIRPFVAKELQQFPLDSGFVGPLTFCQVQKCILYAMELVHFDDTETVLPGHSKIKVMQSSPVLASFEQAGLLDMFPLHDDELLQKLYAQWSKATEPPVSEIRDYFGENVALLVSFTSFYTKFLIPIAIMGIVHYCLDRFLRFDFIYNNLLFACLNLVAVTIFLEMWKRKSNEHAFFFGTSGKLRHKRPRPAFRGKYEKNPITGRDEVTYPVEKTWKTLLTLSVPITILCLVCALIFLLLSFESETLMIEYLTDAETGLVQDDLLSQILSNVPSIAYSVLVMVMNLQYLHLAHWLTEKENHRTQEQFERHAVAKLVSFEFVNTFLALFYIAFYLQDVKMLRSQVFTMLIVTSIITHVQETILPYLLKRPSPRRMMNKIAKRVHLDGKFRKKCLHGEVDQLDCLQTDDQEIHHAKFSLIKDPFESTYDDFMELWLQFGHVFLFSSVYPLAAFFALGNCLLSLKIDAWKLCKLMRKPTPRGVRDIGAWYIAFSITSVISVVTNLILLSLDKDVQAFAPQSSSRDWILMFVFFEHVLLLIRVIIETSIPDVPRKVKLAMDKNDFLLRKQ
jgi:anoctamin-10